MTEKLTWNQPICERCWLERNVIVSGEEVLVRLPILLAEPELETCSYCGLSTIMGAYVRQDPAEVPYPQLEADGE